MVYLNKTRYFVKISTISFVLIQVWFAYVMVNHSYIGVDVREFDGKWIVTGTDVKGNSELSLGDIILNVNDSNVAQFPSVIRWKSLEKADTILVSRNGIEFMVHLGKSHHISTTDILGILGEIISLFVAIMLYKWMSISKSAMYLSFLFFNICVIFMSLGASIRGDPLGKSFINTGLMLIPVVLLHFFIIFFKEKGGLNLPNRFLYIIYAGILLIFLSTSTFYTIDNTAYYVFDIVNDINVPFFICGVFFNLLFLVYIFYKYRNSNAGILSLIKLIFTFIIISFTPLTVFSFFPEIIWGRPWIDAFYTSWAVLFFPLSFTYLLASKKLYDIDLVIRRFFLTTVVSIPPSGAIIGIITLFFPDQSDLSRLVIAFILFVIVFSLTLYSFEYVTTKLERIVFPRKYQLQKSLKKIAKNLGVISSFRELKDIILVDIISTLQVHGGAIVFRYKDSIEMISEGEVDTIELERLAGKDFLAHPLYTWHDIIVNEEYVCYLILAGKKTNTHLGFEETQWLKLITSYLAVSLENIHLIRKLTMKLEQLAAHMPSEEASADFAWFRKLMFELQEKERIRIATDLHDTTMQDLFFLKRRCMSLMEKRRWDTESLSQLNGIMEYIDVINMNLRQSCFELHPFLLQEIGLVRTVEKLIDLEAAASPFHIEFRALNASYIEQCSLDMKRHLFRVVQELLNNAKKHSQASKVKLEISATASRLVLSYMDDGVGFDVHEVVPKEIGGSRSGVEYMKSRILSLDGQFEFVSGFGNGLRLTADFPMKEGRTA